MKTVLFVPGFRQDINSLNYRGTISAIASKGYKVKFVPIKWSYTTLEKWVIQLEKEYVKYDPKKIILSGFSYGSLTALVAASHRPPAELWLFSLSPYFADDLAYIKKSWLKSKRLREEFKQLKLNNFETLKNTKVLIFLGEAEAKKYPLVKRRALLAKKYFKNSKLIMIPNSDHDVGDSNYILAIRQNIG